MVKFLYFILIIVLISSCTQELEEIPIADNVETVNGIKVTWPLDIDDSTKTIVRSLLNDMVYVEGDIYMMGVNYEYDTDARINESPAHYVRLTDYYIMSHEMTFDQVKGLLGNVEGLKEYKSGKKVIRFTWYDWLKVVDVLKRYTNCDFNFPTEAQWEYAARGGKYSCAYKYVGSNNLTEVWNEDPLGANTKPNEIGLYNMSCGYGEWCLDRYNTYKNGIAPLNPIEEICRYSTTASHVVRGGAYNCTNTEMWENNYDFYDDYEKNIRMCRTTARAHAFDDIKYNEFVLRPVINLKAQ